MNTDPVDDISGRRRRITFLAVLTLLLASVAAAAVALFGAATWGASMMAYAGAVESGADRDLMRVVLYFLLAGPFVAGAGLLIGWIVFWTRRPGAGVAWVFLPSLLWVGLLTGYMWAISTFCAGEFTCGV
ncbi:hypothetical protein AB6B38_05915 [Glycocaulis abyssi]|uniref:Integral membrane protein n=1 Tax=Glycocaulis abyssi TaxID=1433403 RepID=A0ABV9NC56_9PROT